MQLVVPWVAGADTETARSMSRMERAISPNKEVYQEIFLQGPRHRSPLES